MTARTLIVVAGYDPGYLAILDHHLHIEAGRSPVVLDITELAPTPIDAYDRGVLRLAGLPYPGADIRSRVEAAGATYVVAGEFLGPDRADPLDDEHETQLEIAVQSALITYFRTDRPNRRRRAVARAEAALRRDGRGTYRAVNGVLDRHPGIDRVYVGNGRFPNQKLASAASRERGLETLHFEKGESPNSSYLQPYAPQNRLASQGSVEELLRGRSDSDIDSIADTWLTRRAPSSESSNEFSSLWSPTLSPRLTAALGNSRPIVGFFTSSQDEFQFLGPEWQLHDWDDQFTAFDLMLAEFEAAGYVAYLRVHPNLSTKNHECFIRERAGIRSLAARHPELVVIWHDDDANTYSLLGVSDAVVVWDSTVGLEASARGIPTWTAATTRYGLVADVRERLSRAAVEAGGMDRWEVDAHAAKRFIAYLVLRDQQMQTDPRDWIAWDTRHPPIATRFAAVLTSGGNPSRLEAVRSVVDVYRHRSLRSNVAHLRRR